MSLSRKFVILLIATVVSIALANILAFYVFYNSFIRLYLAEKIDSRQSVTIEYINNIIERQTLEDIDNIFNDVEFEFFDLLDVNDGNISLENQENVNIVVDYLRKSGVSTKYIEEVIPENSLEKVLFDMKQMDSPESNFVSRMLYSILIFNACLLIAFTSIVFFLSRKIIKPIKNATEQITKLRPWKDKYHIHYNKKDEIGLLVESINALGTKLSVQEKIRSRLLADISHELKTPITSIQCYLEWISDGVIKLSDGNLDAIIWEMNRLVELVNKIMQYEKFENSEIILNKWSYNPYEIISWVVETLQPLLSENHQEVHIIGSKNIEILCDKNLFTQLSYNLIWNFRKYAWEDKLLTIFISTEKISFSDNGKWISKGQIDFLFDKFYQGKIEKSWNINERGIWVWLSIVKKILDSHDWKAKIKSDTGKWFTFEIFF